MALALSRFLGGEDSARVFSSTLRDISQELEQALAGQQQATEGATEKPAEQTAPARNSDAARRIYEYWLRATGRDAARCKFTAERRAKVMARLSSGYTEQDIRRAIDHVAVSAFHQGDNERGQRYDDLITICVNDTRLENYRNLSGVNETPGAYRRDSGTGTGNPFRVETDDTGKLEAVKKRAMDALRKGDADAYAIAEQELQGLQRERDERERAQ